MNILTERRVGGGDGRGDGKFPTEQGKGSSLVEGIH